ncbi:putative outer membrane starch-binding protein [Jejuia pallidilutea]|uniref:Putative outer membrane starch-binding protein n=1 Tax=Jejuia pallidilutea TaxID=504487 RepID=A0A362X3Z3_9FLAO|nr:RagB/SusD family nutrient uptake outer membrane protein [Jejuia pallidilutea]PQV48954.1 putative outer membrane starch-binding protein [Jejuia pallidilutea]
MKKIINIIIPCVMVFFTACEDEFIDLTPPAAITDDVYYTEAEHFLTGSNRFYTNLHRWQDQPLYSDHGSDLVGYDEASDMQEYSRGETQAPASDAYYNNAYNAIRDMNLLLARAEDYQGNDIGEYVAATHFHRAYQYFFLLQRFGGVPLVTEPLDVSSAELYGPRSSRYEVTDQILSDLDQAIAGLPNEANIAGSDKGKISKEAAMAFKADVLLHEATWMKYVGDTTDGDGTSFGAGSAGMNPANINTYLQEVVTLTKSIMDSGTFELWNYNDQLDDLSSNFLFNLEDGGSNPAGLDKATNKEFIFYNKYDFTFRQAGTLLSHVMEGRVKPSRKMIDLFLCSDGLPIDQSPLFQGYANPEDEFQNRDLRMRAYFTNHRNLGVIPTIAGDDRLRLNGTNNFGYFNAKFMSWKWGTDEAYRATQTEAFDMPFIRLAEVYLMYAEALYELNGSLSDAEMNESINLVKERAGLPPLTNAFLTANNLDIGTEIRRERAIELYAEGFTRFNDLKRWGIAEQELGEPIYGAVIEGTVWETDTNLYDPSKYGFPEETTETGVGPRRCLVVQPSSIRNFSRDNYLFPLPTNELGLNDNLLQNPGY